MNGVYERTWDNSPLSNEKILHALSEKGVKGLDVVYYDTVGSTNTEAKKLACVQRPTLLVAEEQTGGRGRMGKSFICPVGAGVYMSLLVYPTLRAEESARLTALAAVAVAEVLRRTANLSTWIKWVNDLYVGDRKLCGILTEGSANTESGMLDYAVIGIGLNVHPAELGTASDIAISLTAAGGRPISRAELIAEITEEIIEALDSLGSSEMLCEYRRLCRMKNVPIRVTRASESFLATSLGVEKDLRLRIEREDGTVELISSGDVSVHPHRIDN